MADLVRISKFLSLILRHKPEEIGLTLDPNGWADVEELLRPRRVCGLSSVSPTRVSKGCGRLRQVPQRTWLRTTSGEHRAVSYTSPSGSISAIEFSKIRHKKPGCGVRRIEACNVLT